MKLNPLPKEKTLQKLKNIVNGESWNISLTLLSGHFLIGSFFPEWIHKTAKNADIIWFPKASQNQPEDFRFGFVFEDGFKIVFNSPKGTTHGNANLINVPFDKIADIKKLAWENPDLKEKGLKNISNPLATIINKCNVVAAEKNSLKVMLYCEMALAQENVGEEGISFNDDELIYIDIDFFNNCQGSVDVGPMSFGSSIAAYALANTKLQNSILQRTLNNISGNLAEPRNFLGTLHLPTEEITTTLEGEDCFIVICQTEDFSLPACLKRNSLSYPFEYMSLIKSLLVFYGEIKQIPINILGERYDRVLFTRALGFIRNKCT